jgi:hypothetical protein
LDLKDAIMMLETCWPADGKVMIRTAEGVFEVDKIFPSDGKVMITVKD